MQRFEKTNEMLTNCNALSAGRLKTVGPEFKKHTQLLLEMKKDLDYIFKKIRAIKTKLSTQYPEAYAEALRSSLAEECKEDEPEGPSDQMNNGSKGEDMNKTTEDKRNEECEESSETLSRGSQDAMQLET